MTRRVRHVMATGRSVLARRPWSAAASLAVVLVLAGLLFTTSAHTARGTQLRTDRADAAALLRHEQERRAEADDRVRALRAEIGARTSAVAAVDGSVRALSRRGEPLAVSAGLHPVSGPVVEVVLTDAPGTLPRADGAHPDDLVVHQQDVQAVVNALWDGGAEAMMIMDQRIVGTSAVRCVGNTLLLQGRVYSPPYRIAAIGDPDRLVAALTRSPQIGVYREYVAAYGLGYDVKRVGSRTFPGFEGSTELRFATVPATAGAPPSARPPSSSSTPATGG